MGNVCRKRFFSFDMDDENLIRAVRKSYIKSFQNGFNSKDYGTVSRALVEAAFFTDIGILEYFAKTADINVVNAKGQTALLVAVTSGNRSSVQRLLDVGADPNICHRDTGDSPLILATKLGFSEIINTLLKIKALVDYVNSISDLSALMEACQYGKQDIVNILIEAGKCDVELVNGKLENALMVACFSGHMGIVQLLIRFGCRLDCVNINGENALMKAVGQGHFIIVKFLVEQGADVCAVDKEGKTAETYARERGFTAIEQYLVEKISTFISNVSNRAEVTGALIGGPAEVDVVSDCKDGELKDKTLRRKPAHNVTNNHLTVIKDNDIKIIDVIPTNNANINSDLYNDLSPKTPEDSIINCATLTISFNGPNSSSNKCQINISDNCDSLTKCSEFNECTCNNLETSTHSSQCALTSHYNETPICSNIDTSTVSYTECDSDKNFVPYTNTASTIDTSSFLKRDSVTRETFSSGFLETPSRDFCKTSSNRLYETAEWCKSSDFCTSPEQSTTDMSTFSEFSTPDSESSSPRLPCDSNASLHQENEISSQAVTNEETNTSPSYDESKTCLKRNYYRSKTFPRRTKPLWMKDERLIDGTSHNAIRANTHSGASNDPRSYSSPSANTMDQAEPIEKRNKPKKCKKEKRPKIIVYANVANVNTAKTVLVNGNDDHIYPSSSTETDEFSD